MLNLQFRGALTYNTTKLIQRTMVGGLYRFQIEHSK